MMSVMYKALLDLAQKRMMLDQNLQVQARQMRRLRFMIMVLQLE